MLKVIIEMCVLIVAIVLFLVAMFVFGDFFKTILVSYFFP